MGAGYRLNMSEIISISFSAAAIFSALESCGLPPNRKDIVDWTEDENDEFGKRGTADAKR